MSVIRAFIAFSLSDEIYQRLDQLIKQFQGRLQGVPVRWVPARNIHLTIKFLGDVSVANLDILKKTLKAEVSHHSPFEVSVGEVGAFPSTRRARVIWVGVEAPPELQAVQHGIENEMARLGYTREERPFSPHLTLGRVSRNAVSDDHRRIGEVLESSKVGFMGAVRVEEIYLFRSDLQPGGSVYTQLFSAPLALPAA